MTAARLSVHCVQVRPRRILFDIDGMVPLYPASTLKVAVLIAAYEAIDAGRLEHVERLTLPARWPALDGGRFTLCEEDSDPVLRGQPGASFPVELLLERMIVASSNEASNMLIARLGLEAVNQAAARAGAKNTRMRHYFGDRRAWGTAAANVSTAADLASLIAAIAAAEAASPDSCARMLRVLEAQQDRALIPAALPAAARCANKTGTADRVLHDLALVCEPGLPQYALAICALDHPTPELAAAAIRKCAREVHQLLAGDPRVQVR